jgi:hypothetical protein
MHRLFTNHINRLTILIVFEDFFGCGECTDFSFIPLSVGLRDRKPCRYIGIDTCISEAVVKVMGEVPGGRIIHEGIIYPSSKSQLFSAYWFKESSLFVSQKSMLCEFEHWSI